MSQVRLLNGREAQMQHAKKARKRARKANGKKRRAGKHARKHNGYSAMTDAKPNRHARRRAKHARKRNDAGSGSMLMRVAKFAGVVLLGVGLTIGATLALSSTSLSAGMQDGILIAGGIVLAGAAFAYGKPVLAAAFVTPMLGLAFSRRVIVWGLASRIQAGVASLNTMVGGTPAPAQIPATVAPGGYVADARQFGPGVAQNTRLGDFANMSTPLPAYALG